MILYVLMLIVLHLSMLSSYEDPREYWDIERCIYG